MLAFYRDHVQHDWRRRHRIHRECRRAAGGGLQRKLRYDEVSVAVLTARSTTWKGGFLIASRNIPVIGDAELTNTEMVYVSVPKEFWLVLASNSPGDTKENVVPLSEVAFLIETGICELDNVGDAAVVYSSAKSPSMWPGFP